MLLVIIINYFLWDWILNLAGVLFTVVCIIFYFIFLSSDLGSIFSSVFKINKLYPYRVNFPFWVGITNQFLLIIYSSFIQSFCKCSFEFVWTDTIEWNSNKNSQKKILFNYGHPHPRQECKIWFTVCDVKRLRCPWKG